MKYLGLVLSGVIANALISPALAQQRNSAPAGPHYGYGYHMWYGPGWDGGWGWHPWFFLGPLFMLVVLAGIVLLIVWLARSLIFGGQGWHHSLYGGSGPCPTCGRRGRGPALDVLSERLARGEIDKDEYEEKRKLLGG
jgi:putative membrane protein